MKIHNSPVVFFALFAISGFTGLIYESIWTHYLKLFLGHAAYAQALVLTIFMGGMAFGAYMTARLSIKWTNLLVVYAIVEILIGCFGVIFHPLFQTVLSISYEDIIPTLGTPALVHSYKWAIGALIILPQSILLGMTFPLMSNGIIRRFPDTPGKTLGMLYFTNSIGAAIGVLFSGFYLIKTIGLPGTILTAGIINIFLAIIVYGIAKGPSEQTYVIKKSSSSLIKSPYLILLAAFITGTASFIYEISWIRMLSMVLGASTHAFELMLSAFITGLAFGGLWVRRKIDNLDNPIRTTGYIQITMGMMALLTLPLYNYSFELMSFFISGLERNDTGYEFFMASSHFICLIIMLPTTFCAGMTLPLFTFIMLRQGYGEKSIGQIYASNTLGAIVGIIFTVFIGMPVLGLKGAILLGCSLDLLLGLFLLSRANLPGKNSIAIFATISGIAIGGMIFIFDLDLWKMNSGVYREGTIITETDFKVLFHKDAKTTSVGVLKDVSGNVSIMTNGKTDASIIMDKSDQISVDEVTTTLLAALPIAINPNAKLIANIGMGSGLTTHTLLTWPGVERVDTIEIEPAMVEGANYFRPRVEHAFTDPRSKIHIEDAKTYFSTHKKKYDIIISEPSNPWVSGIASLFTKEFYNHITNYMTDEGLFVQWIQAYEINPQLLFSVLKALKNNFSDFSLYTPNDTDLIIIARNNHTTNRLGTDVFNNGPMEKALANIGVHNMQDIEVRFIADHHILSPLIDKYGQATNSDYFPYLDLNAARARFKQENIHEMARLGSNIIPFIKILSPDHDNKVATNVSGDSSYSQINQVTHQAQNLFHSLGNLDITTPENPVAAKLKLMATLANSCQSINFPKMWIDNLNTLAALTVPYLSPSELHAIWIVITPKCNNGLNDDQLNWLELVKALSQRNSESIATYSSILLEQGDYWDIQQQRLLLTAQATALVKLEKFQLAQQLFSQHVGKLYQGEAIPLTLLILDSLTTNNPIKK